IDGRRLPLYFEMRLLQEHVWFQPLLVYATAAVLKVLPASQSVFRFPAVAVGMIDVLLMYFVAGRLFRDRRWQVGAALLLGLTPAHMLHSRLTMDFIYPLPFVLGWLLCLLVYLEKRRPWILFAGTSVLGVGFYSYIASVVMMPACLALTWMALFLAGIRSIRPYAVAAGGFAWPLVAIVAWLPSHTAMVLDTLARYHLDAGVFRPTAITDRVSTYWRFFDPAFLFMIGGYTRMTNSTRLVGVFLLPLIVLIPLGVVEVFTVRRTPIGWVVLFGFLLSPVAGAIAVPAEPYASDRALPALVFGVLLAIFGLERLLAMSSRWAHVAAGVLLAMVPLHFAFFLVHYFGDYHRRAAYWFEWDHLGALHQVIAHAPGHDRPIWLSTGDDTMMEAYWRLAVAMEHRVDLLETTRYFDARHAEVSGLPPHALVLMNRNDTSLAALVAAGQLHRVATIPEPGDEPYYFVVER
ncbi:MAG TPA: glycosyltransferase family 39 protein, partial [Vicinamibacterales bacterium]|nr:glycosyltransferase family 39 protein [Vicinamibacterales bacterium]